MKLLPLFRSAALGFLLLSPRLMAEEPARPWVSVSEFGALGQARRVNDGWMNAGSTTFVSASAHFTARDEGQPISVLRAGVQDVGELKQVPGAPLTSRIVKVIDGSTAVLADSAHQLVTGALACWGPDETDAIQRAIDSIAATGGTVYVPPGLYRLSYRGGPALKIAHSHIHLQGSGPGSMLFNATVLFRAKEKDGQLLTEQGGVPVLYAGDQKQGIEDVEVDHLWLGDNGQEYSFRNWGPHGPGVLGSAGKIDRFHFHDLTIETNFLCGVNMNSETAGFEIDHVTVNCSGEHGFYLAGTGSDGDVHDNCLASITVPMRQGIAVKKKQRIQIRHNEIAHVDFQGIGVEGDSPDYTSRHVLIADNWLHDLTPWHTEGICLFNAEDVIVRHNRIEDTSWIGISLRTSHYPVSNVVLAENVITRAGQMNPCFAISVNYTRPPGLDPSSPAPGRISDVVIEKNVITDCPNGISVVNATGQNRIERNHVESATVRETGVAYRIDTPPEGSSATFGANASVNYPRSSVGKGISAESNELH